MQRLIISLILIALVSSNAYAIWPFTRHSDMISYYAPCWGEGNKIYFIKKVTHGTYIAFTPFALLQMGRYSVDKIEYYLCSMNYDGRDKEEIKELMCEKNIDRLKKEYKRRYGREWAGGSKLNAYMSYCEDTNKLVYNLEWGMWSINVNGTGERLLDHHGIHPSFSPDGKKIVYWILGQPRDRYLEENYYTAHRSIWVMNADGSNKKMISTTKIPEEQRDGTVVYKFDDTNPIWSPKGDLIAFVCKGWIWVMKPDGSERRRVIDGRHLYGWLSDGKKLLIGGYIFDLDGNLIKDIGFGGYGGYISLDAKLIANPGFTIFDMERKFKIDPFADIKHPKHFVYKKPNNIW
ncbi:MAG: hypothetical protein AB1414_19815 [bacterium]